MMTTVDTDIDREVFLGFIDESMEGLADAENAMIRLEADPGNRDHIAAIFRSAHSLKGNSAFFGLMRIRTLAHKMEDLLDAVRQQRLSGSRRVVDALLPGLDLLRQMLENVRDEKPEVGDPDLFNSVVSQLEQTLNETDAPRFEPAITPAEKTGDEEKPKPDTPPAVQAPSSERTLRIAESSLDAFLDHVGELIGIEEMLRYCLRQTGGTGDTDTYRELKQVIEQFCKVSADLRSGIMETRKVKAKALLEKAPRLIRDVAVRTDKQISVVIKGTDLRIDKNYSDLLDAPLVHMVRNAADHGIEPPDQRKAAGKPEKGAIEIELAEMENDIRLTVRDDGRGLNNEALTQKAVSMGLVEPGQALDSDGIIRLLFASGVSTAAEITDISGRGVGMDVVKQAIDAAGGQIRVDSTTGRGCVFTILLPKNVSTKIIDGYLVKGKNNSMFVLPLKSVIEAFVADQSEITTVKQQGCVVKRRDTLHPILDLDTAVQGEGTLSPVSSGVPASDATLVLLDIGRRTVALSVAEIVGVQKVVVKAIQGLTSQNSMIEGAAVMGDGGVALIIGNQGLSRILTDTASTPRRRLKTVRKVTAS